MGELRWPFTGMVSAMHLGILVWLGYLELEWMLLVIALTLTSTGG